ncbi:sigma-70 family RNA polymerase sigma factor [Nonomuraea sp. NPDC050328]|uniref:sigma-70 family RNA polymerase sigma factor n=1 Tax=Nonomuraea sp. NPDC050328 TaxID=3364361 RepID=UPI003795F3D4
MTTTVDELARRFEDDRAHLRAVAYRMLGSLAEAEDAVQEAWFRLSRTDVSEVGNLTGWLTTVVGRICLDLLRARAARPEEVGEAHVPDPVVSPVDGADPEHEALVRDAVGLALLVVLEELAPAERLAFVLHDMFGMPFEEIAPIVERNPAATRQLASRARRRVRQARVVPDADLALQREVVEAFMAASREGDFDALVELLDPEVVLRADYGAEPVGASKWVRGAHQVAATALTFRRLAAYQRLALVNGGLGLVSLPGGKPFAVLGFTVVDGRIVEIDVLADPARMAVLALPDLG